MNRIIVFLGVLSVCFCTSAAGQLVITHQDDPGVLASEILGPGITLVGGSPVLTGSTGQTGSNGEVGGIPGWSAGTFTGGAAAGIVVDSGIILSTGDVGQAPGSNLSDRTTWFNPDANGDPDLDNLIIEQSVDPTPPLTKEAVVLEMEFESDSGNVSFNFVFASEEYNEYVFTGVSDVFGLFVDGENLALVPGTSTYVSIDTVNGGGGHFDNPAYPYGTGAINPEYYNNNDLSDGGGSFNIEYDGFTTVFTAQKLGLSPGTHTLKLAIADVGDKEVDSAVFIEAHSLTDEPHAVPLACNCDTPGLFDPPMDKDITVKKGNRVIPLKFALCDAEGFPANGLMASPPMANVDYTGPAGELVFEADDYLTAGHGDDGNLFVLVDGHWQLNLQTKMFEASGIYEITAVSTDPDYVIDPTCAVRFEIE